MEIYVISWINSKLMWTATLKMWIHHISTSCKCGSTTSCKCGSTTSPHFHYVEFPHLHIRQFDLYPLFNQYYFLSISKVDSSMVQSLLQLSERWPYHFRLVGKITFASLEANLDWGLLVFYSILLVSLALSGRRPDMTSILLTGTLCLNSIKRSNLSIVKGIIHTFLKCIYYRVYSMAGIIPHQMFVNALLLACN